MSNCNVCVADFVKYGTDTMIDVILREMIVCFIYCFCNIVPCIAQLCCTFMHSIISLIRDHESPSLFRIVFGEF